MIVFDFVWGVADAMSGLVRDAAGSAPKQNRQSMNRPCSTLDNDRGLLRHGRPERGRMSPISQHVQAPFCLLPIRLVANPTAPSFRIMALAPLGAAILVFGIWDLLQAPEYSVSVVIMMFGGALLWGGALHIRRVLWPARVPVGYWLGVDPQNLIFADHDRMFSWPWSKVCAFRVTESVSNEFVTTYQGRGLDDAIDFKQTHTVMLAAETLDGPPVEIPFGHFADADQDPRAGADTLCLFLNDVRERALNGGLERNAAPFLAPAEFRIVPMQAGAPAQGPSRRTRMPAVRRQ